MGKIVWSKLTAEDKIRGVVGTCGLMFSEHKYRASEDRANAAPNHHWIESYATNGIRLSQHKNTWARKRSTGYLICIEYVWEGNIIYKRVEPWVSYPSDILITQLTLLPREVK